MYPSKVTPTFWDQSIVHFNDGKATTFSVSFKTINEKCYDPEVQFVYQRIDFDEAQEYIDIYDNTSINLISKCGAGQNTPNDCHVYDICFVGQDQYGYHLGLDYIEMSDIYKITLTESSFVDALCGNRTYSINGILYMVCNQLTDIPQQNDTFSISGAVDGQDVIKETIVTNLAYSFIETEQRFDIFIEYITNDCLNPIFTLSTDIKVMLQIDKIQEFIIKSLRKLVNVYQQHLQYVQDHQLVYQIIK